MVDSTRVHFDTAAFHAALDARREMLGHSWRRLATDAGVSPSLLSRLGGRENYQPGITMILSLCAWLQTPVETYASFVDAPRPAPEAPHAVLLQLLPVLRAQLDRDDADYVEGVLRATLKFISRRQRS